MIIPKLKPVDSSAVEAMAYQSKTHKMWVLFKSSKKLYCYFDVNKDIFDEVFNADSIGSAMQSLVVSKFSYEHIDTFAHQESKNKPVISLFIPNQPMPESFWF